MNNMRWLITRACLFTLGITLTGCEGVRSTLGLDRSPPDEFAVLKRAPLSMPPEMNILPPPVDLPKGYDVESDVYGGTDLRPQEISPQTRVKKGFGFREDGYHPANPGERALGNMIKKQVSYDSNEAKDVRAILDDETHIKTGSKKTWVQRILFWQKNQKKFPDALNAAEEYKRLHGSLPGDEGITY